MNKFNNTFSDCLKSYWVDYVGWGRATRKEFWLSMFVYNILGSMVTMFIDPIIFIMWLLVTIVPNFCLTARRLHDINLSNWFILLSLIPYLGCFILLIFMVTKGDLLKNNYGKPRI